MLYIQREPFQVQCRQSEKDDELTKMRDRVSTVALLLRQLPPETDPQLRNNLLSVLDAPPSVPPELRPDSMGQIPASG